MVYERLTAWFTEWEALSVMEFGPDGRLYVDDAFGDVLTMYDSDGSELGTIEYESSVPPEVGLQSDIAIGPDGRLYLLEATAGARVLVYEPDGTLVAEWGGTFPSDPFAEESLFDAQAIAVAPDGHVFVAKLGGRLQKFTSDGDFVTVWDRAGDYLFPAEVYDMDVADGVLYVAAGGYRDIQHTVIMMFDFDGNLVSEPIVVGEGDIEGRSFPASIAIGPNRNLFIVDPFKREVVILSSTGDEVSRWSLNETEQRFPNVEIAVDEDGRVYVADDGRKEIVIYAPGQAD